MPDYFNNAYIRVPDRQFPTAAFRCRVVGQPWGSFFSHYPLVNHTRYVTRHALWKDPTYVRSGLPGTSCRMDI